MEMSGIIEKSINLGLGLSHTRGRKLK